ncbi:hypothetical protein J2W18_004686 [Rhodococcus cercidiphylli]|nr:hypothetical protein [Rhodococcus cercidiphylli]
MRDLDVRAALHSQLIADHADCIDDTLIVDELGLCGEVRVDVAVVNGVLSGFEIKSARDTLRRLPKQVEIYSSVLDHAVLVVADNHLRSAMSIVPDWWGVIRAEGLAGSVTLATERMTELNRAIEPMSLAQLLWREEALEELDLRDAARGVRSKPRWAVWGRLVDTVDIDELRGVVRNRLKARRSSPIGQ